MKEQLFPGREDEIGPAVDALQHFVLEFHGDAPFNQSLLDTLAEPERADTHSPRKNAGFPPLFSVALLKIDPGFGRPYRQKYGLLQIAKREC